MMSTRRVLRNLSSKARFLSTISYITSTNPIKIYPTPLSFATNKILSCRETYSWGLRSFHGAKYQIHHERSSVVEEQLDPFSLVADELSVVADRLRNMVVTEVPKLALAAEYFFKMGVEGKRFRPTIVLLMASALNMSTSTPESDIVSSAEELRTRQQSMAMITEMIHVASLLHDDVLDDAETRRDVTCLMR